MPEPNEKDEVFLGAGSLNLLIELEGLAGKVSPHVEQYETVQTRLPQKSRRAEAVGGMFLGIQGEVWVLEQLHTVGFSG